MSEADPDWKAKLRESLKESEQFDKMISRKRRGRSNKKNSSTKNKNSISSIKFDKKFSSSTRSKTTVSSDDVTQKISFTNSSSSSTSSSTFAYSSKVAKGNVSSSSKENISNNKKPTTQKPKRAFGRRLLGGRLLGGKAIRRTGLGGPLAVIEEDENDENETTATISETHAARESTFSPALPYPPAPSSVNKLVVVKEAEEQEQPKDDKEVEFLEDTAPTKKQLLSENTIVFNDNPKRMSSGSDRSRSSVDDDEATVALFHVPPSNGKAKSTLHSTPANNPQSQQERPARNASSRTPRATSTKPSSTKSSTNSSTKSSTTKSSKKISKSKHIHVNGLSYGKLSLLGRGGSCKVFKVQSIQDQSILALKRIKLSRTDRKTIAMFENEIDLMKRLRGRDNIIQLVDSEINISKKLIYMVMEAGEMDLAHTLENKKIQQMKMNREKNKDDAIHSSLKGGGLDVQFLRETWQQMLEAVNTIHEERIVHTDLKPANFLFVKGVLKLIDFGIAKAISDDTTNIHRENQVGTLNYISPEALIDTSGKKSSLGNKNGMDMKLGRSSDIWSLGCILYQMVYGKTPFAELGLVQKLQAIVSEEYNIPYPTVDPMYDNAIDVIKLCLQRNSKRRPSIMGTNGLLDHLFLHPERKQVSCSASDATDNDALALDNLSLIQAMQHCFSSAENTNSEDNMEQFKLLVNTILSTGQEMERLHMQGPGLRGTVADNIVDQLQQALEMSTMDGGSGGGALVFDGTKAVRHAKDVALRAQKMSTMSGKSGGNKMARPVRKMDFIGQLKKKKSVLNKAPKQQKAKQVESTGLKAVLEQGFASRFAKANLSRANEDCTLGNWTLSDDF